MGRERQIFHRRPFRKGSPESGIRQAQAQEIVPGMPPLVPEARQREAQASRPFPLPPKHEQPPLDTFNWQPDTAKIEALRNEIQVIDENAESTIEVVSGGVYEKKHIANMKAKKGMKWYTPIEVETYTISNPDGTQKVYVQRLAKERQRLPKDEDGVFLETYSAPHGRFNKRERLSRERVGELAQYEWEIGPDGEPARKMNIFTEKYSFSLLALHQGQFHIHIELILQRALY